jgi:hypothetical protein
VLSGLVCTDLAYNGKYLKYDTRIDCNSTDYAAYRQFALSMVVVWVIGYPALVLGLLCYYKVPMIAARKLRRAELGAFLTHSMRLETLPSLEGAGGAQEPMPSKNLLALIARVFRVVALARRRDSVTSTAHSQRASTTAERARADYSANSLDELGLPELRYLAQLHSVQEASTLAKDMLAKALNERMEKMIDSKEIAVPVVSWDLNSPDEDERCACDRLGQIFMAYETRWWM